MTHTQAAVMLTQKLRIIKLHISIHNLYIVKSIKIQICSQPTAADENKYVHFKSLLAANHVVHHLLL